MASNLGLHCLPVTHLGEQILSIVCTLQVQTITVPTRYSLVQNEQQDLSPDRIARLILHILFLKILSL